MLRESKQALKYQWYFRKAGASIWNCWNGHNTPITSAVSNSSWNGMQVYCTVTDDTGNTVSSAPATIILNIKQLQITQQPKDATAPINGKVTFSVKAQGEGSLAYQWYYRKAGVSVWSEWKGHTTASTYAYPNATWDGIQLYCVVRDNFGNKVSSLPATVKLDITQLQILEDPQDVTVNVGGKATFSVKARGENLRYQWYFRKAGASAWTLWNGHTTANTYANANITWNGIQLYCVVKDVFGNTLSSKPATVTLNITPLQIIEQPKDILVPLNGKASFTVKAKGEGVRYQWYTKKIGATEWKLWSGHTISSIYAYANASWDGIKLYCVVSDSFGNTLSSEIATVTLDVVQLAITEQPSDTCVRVGESASISVKAQGQELRYQWYYRKAGVADWTSWYSHTRASTSVNTSLAWDGSQYYCVIKDVLGRTVSSDIVTLVLLKDELAITKQPEDITVKIGEKAVFSLKAQGLDLKYQWYYRKAGTETWNRWNNHNTATTSAICNATWNGLQAYCTITDYQGNTVSSEPATVILDFVPLSIKAQPLDTTVKLGDDVSFTVDAEGESLQYQWYYRKAGTSKWNTWWWNGSLNRRGVQKTVIAKTDSFDWEGMQVYCLIKDVFGNTVSTEPATVSLDIRTLKILSQPEDVLVEVDENVSFSVEADGNGLSYQWYYKKSGSTSWSIWKNRTTPETTAKANISWHGMQVYCQIRDILGNCISSQPATISLKLETITPLKLLAQTTDVTVNYNSSVNFSVRAQGESLSYQWYYRDADTNNWRELYNSNYADITVTANADWNGRQVYCAIKDGLGNTISSEPITVTINTKQLIIISQPEDVTVDVNGRVSFSVTAEGDGLSYQWYYRKAGVAEWRLWSGHTSATTSSATNATWNGLQVYCIVTDAYGNSTSSMSATVTLNVTPLKIIYHPQNTTANVGGIVSFNVKAQGDELTYCWYFRKSGETEWSVWKNCTSANLSATSDITWDRMQVYCVVKDFVGNETASSVATVTLNITPLRILTQPKDATANSGSNISFSVFAQGESVKYQWYFKKSDEENWTLWEGRNGSTVSMTADESWNGTQVRCDITDILGNTISSDTAEITVM